MENKCKRIMIGAIVLLNFFLSVTVFAAAEPVLESFTIDPVEPTPLSDITVTANIQGEDITSVVVHIKECNQNQGVCFSEQSGEMNYLEPGKYQAQFTLVETEADYIQYYFDIIIDGEEVRLDETWTIDLLVNSNDNNGDNGTPGFEFVILIASIGVGVLFFRKKRLR
jgi:hypothetical protein